MLISRRESDKPERGKPEPGEQKLDTLESRTVRRFLC